MCIRDRESTDDKTLCRINRGHTFHAAADAVERTASRGILTGGHVILGLPGETHESIVAQAGVLSRLPLTTLKMHPVSYTHLAIQCGSVGSLESEEFLPWHVIAADFLLQCRIVHQGGKSLAGIVVQRNDGRSVQIGITVHIVLHVRTELRTVCSGL